MGPSEAQQVSGLESTEEEPITSSPFLPEYSESNPDPLESTHLDGSFQAVWTEPFEIFTSPEDQFEDYGEVESCSSKRSSHYRQTACTDHSSFDPEVTSCCESVEKLSFLEDRILELEGEKNQHEESVHKLQQINKDLVKRVHMLEEQLEDAKLHLEEERREHLTLRESFLHKAERKWSLDMVKLQTRVKFLQEENSQLYLSISSLNSEKKVLEKNVQSLVAEVLEISDSLAKECEKKQQWEESIRQEKASWESQQQETAQLLEELRSELASLRQTDGTVQCSDDAVCARALWEECKQETHKLAEENRGLRELNEELQDALLIQKGSHSFEQTISSTLGSPVRSIADEIDVCTKDQISALNEQKETNRCLRQYLDHIILSVLEKDPTLLEIKPNKKQDCLRGGGY